MTVEEKISDLGYVLPEAPAPVGSYLNAVRSGNQLHISGGLPFSEGEKIIGQVPTDVSIEDARRAAEMIILNRLSVAKAELGSLNQITQVISLSGFVNSASDFYDHPKVINAASDLLVKILGDAGRHARVAMGGSALPLNAAVEISLILEVE